MLLSCWLPIARIYGQLQSCVFPFTLSGSGQNNNNAGRFPVVETNSNIDCGGLNENGPIDTQGVALLGDVAWLKDVCP